MICACALRCRSQAPSPVMVSGAGVWVGLRIRKYTCRNKWEYPTKLQWCLLVFLDFPTESFSGYSQLFLAYLRLDTRHSDAKRGFHVRMYVLRWFFPMIEPLIIVPFNAPHRAPTSSGFSSTSCHRRPESTPWIIQNPQRTLAAESVWQHGTLLDSFVLAVWPLLYSRVRSWPLGSYKRIAHPSDHDLLN